MSRTVKILISNWPRTQLAITGRKGSCFWNFSPLSHKGDDLRPISILWLVKIWQVSSCGKFMQRLETLLLIAEADRVLCHLVMFLTVFFHWMYKMKYRASCYKDSSVVHGWFFYWVFGWEVRRLSKSSEILFRMASIVFNGFSPCLMRKRFEKSQAILALLESFQEPHLDW